MANLDFPAEDASLEARLEWSERVLQTPPPESSQAAAADARMRAAAWKFQLLRLDLTDDFEKLIRVGMETWLRQAAVAETLEAERTRLQERVEDRDAARTMHQANLDQAEALTTATKALVFVTAVLIIATLVAAFIARG